MTCCLVFNSARGNRPVKEFILATAGYLGTSADDITRRIKNCLRRALPLTQAKQLVEQRGSCAKALAASGFFPFGFYPLVLFIRSTYEEYSPDFDTYPTGQVWAAAPADYAAGWEAVQAYLCQQQGWRELTHPETGCIGLAPEGHTETVTYFGDTLILNDAETIEIITPA